MVYDREKNIIACRKYRQTEKGRKANMRVCKKYRQSEKGRTIRKKWKEKNPNYQRIYYSQHRDEILESNREYMKTSAGKLANTRRFNKHQDKGFILLVNNPFPEEIEVDYYHISPNLPFVIPMPRITHRYVDGKRGEEHFIHNLHWIKILYCL